MTISSLLPVFTVIDDGLFDRAAGGIVVFLMSSTIHSSVGDGVGGSDIDLFRFLVAVVTTVFW